MSRVEVYGEVSINDHYEVMDRSIMEDLVDGHYASVVDTGGLSRGQRLLRCSKGNVVFGVTTVVVIKQLINNYNHYHTDPSLTFIVSKHPLSA
ncbi:hypothetical protein PVK06_001662 [Gossypium arboreum]|uniref:Uncharacterized protein n=1 Tax=Gossypium arboreum TaxID=29729 RepID=A0ABR0R1S1_GOSAR|nr:hypothetical protein PVK06_001662 [Gossypium arboreum]